MVSILQRRCHNGDCAVVKDEQWAPEHEHEHPSALAYITAYASDSSLP